MVGDKIFKLGRYLLRRSLKDIVPLTFYLQRENKRFWKPFIRSHNNFLTLIRKSDALKSTERQKNHQELSKDKNQIGICFVFKFLHQIRYHRNGHEVITVTNQNHLLRSADKDSSRRQSMCPFVDASQFINFLMNKLNIFLFMIAWHFTCQKYMFHKYWLYLILFNIDLNIRKLPTDKMCTWVAYVWPWLSCKDVIFVFVFDL